MIILITGSRDTPETDYKKLAEAITTHITGVTAIAHGGAIGADQLASKYATLNGLKEIVIKPNYVRYKKAAPLVRNNELVKLADKVLAWHTNDKRSRGTAYTAKLAARKGKLIAEYIAGKRQPEANDTQIKLW